MSRKKYLEELLGSSLKEINVKIQEGKKSLFHLKMKNRAGSLKNNAEIRQTRRDIARAKTILISKIQHNNESIKQ